MKAFKERKLQTLEIPPQVIAAFQRVQQMIEREDPPTTVPSDDMIQVGPLCGGLQEPEESDGKDFFFSVHLPPDSSHLWYVDLDKDEIQAIANGESTTVSLWGCQDPACGFKSSKPEASCHWCDSGGQRRLRKEIEIPDIPEPTLDAAIRQLIEAEEEPDPQAVAHLPPDLLKKFWEARRFVAFLRQAEKADKTPPAGAKHRIDPRDIGKWLSDK